MGGQYCYITHFKGEKMEAQQDSVTCPSLSASKWQRSSKKIIYLFTFLVALGLCTCVWALSSCAEQGLIFTGVQWLLIVVASFVAEHRL